MALVIVILGFIAGFLFGVSKLLDALYRNKYISEEAYIYLSDFTNLFKLF